MIHVYNPERLLIFRALHTYIWIWRLLDRIGPVGRFSEKHNLDNLHFMLYLHNSYGADLVGILRWDHKEPTLFISENPLQTPLGAQLNLRGIQIALLYLFVQLVFRDKESLDLRPDIQPTGYQKFSTMILLSLYTFIKM